MSQLTSEHASTGRRYSVARGAVAFLLFLLPKLSDEAEQRQQMVPRALRLLDFLGRLSAGYADGPRNGLLLVCGTS
jgi:hypothetical protein